MNGRIVGGFIVVSALVVGALIYWLQEYAYYFPVTTAEPGGEIRLVSLTSGVPEPIAVENFEAIDANSSPLRFRACFRVENSLAMLSETYELATDAEPLNGPRWFRCYDSGRITAALASGEALAFMADPDIRPGIQRIVAVFEDGSAYAWHQLGPDLRDTGPPPLE